MSVKALYIHIPFCDHICIYCDFYKMIAKEKEINKYINYLIKELEMKKQYFSDLETIYIGGGTPSRVNLDDLQRLFDKLNELIYLNNIKEFTFECNPKDINLDLISLFKKYNVNRISLGAQTFNNKKLQTLRRNHTDKDIIKAIKLLQDNNIDNINCDIIYGLSTDTVTLIKKDLEKLLELHIPHISCYTLIVEEKTILNHMIKEFNYKPLSDDEEALIYDYITTYLEKSDYSHYEISNYALSGKESKHNYTYWMNENYIACGAGASYYIDNVRYTNINNLNKYYQGIDENKLIYLEEEKVSYEDNIFNEIMLKLRTIKGIDINEFEKKFNKSIFEFKNLEKNINNGNLILENNILRINPQRFYISNSIIVDLLD